METNHNFSWENSLFLWPFSSSQTVTLWWTYKKLWKMAIEIVDFPLRMVIFHSFLYVHQRVVITRPGNSLQLPVDLLICWRRITGNHWTRSPFNVLLPNVMKTAQKLPTNGIYLLKMLIYPTKMVILWDCMGILWWFYGISMEPSGYLLHSHGIDGPNRNRWFCELNLHLWLGFSSRRTVSHNQVVDKTQ